MSRKKVIVAGHSCLDVTPEFAQVDKVAEISKILSPGKLVLTKGVDIHSGGAVSNTGIAMKLLGLDVSLVTMIGNDPFGELLLQIYRKYGVADHVIISKEESTSYSVVLAVPGIDRIFLHDPGCNMVFSFEDIKELDLSDVILFHFGYPPLMKQMYDKDGEQLTAMFQYLKSKGIATSMDMAFVDEKCEAGKADWTKILTNTLPYVDFFVPSVEELCWMIDRPRYNSWIERAKGKDMVSILDPDKDIRPLTDKCMEMGTSVLLLKCGAPGLFYRTAGEEKVRGLSSITGIDTKDWSNQIGFEVSYQPRRVLSGTGAGDTTIAAFLTAMLKGYSFDMSIHLAAAEGASCVEEYGALGGIKTLDVLEEKIKNGWEKSNQTK